MTYQPVQLEYEVRRARGIPNLRWMVGGMLFLAAILNYIDRQALSILAPTIQSKLGINDIKYGTLNNYFLVAYTISLLATGRLVDKLGPRIAMAMFITWWSLANMATGLAIGFATLATCRFFLGLGEAGNWPGSAKAVSEWFPPKERAFAIGFYTMGASVGATVAPIMVLGLARFFNWQAAFVATGAIGLLWVVPWLWLYRRPDLHPRITPRELEIIRADGNAPAATPQEPEQSEAQRWKEALGNRTVWALALGRLLTDPVWYFYQFWFAKYLFSARQVSQEGLAVTTFVYLAADFGSLLGGLASGYLIRRRFGPGAARLWTMLICAVLVPLSMAVPKVGSVAVVVILGMIVVLAHLAWLANITALVVDLIPKRLLATCFGIVAAGSAAGGIAMNEVVKRLAQAQHYHPWFVAMAFLHPLAWILLFVVLRRRLMASAAATVEASA